MFPSHEAPLKPVSPIERLIRIAAAALLASLLLADGPALAQGHRGENRERPGGGPHGDGGGWARGPSGGYGGPHGYAPPPAYGPVPGTYPHGAPPRYVLRRGGQVPPEYRSAIVPDYGRHRLRPPPPGFAWVRMGGRYMLISRSTGQIFDVIGP